MEKEKHHDSKYGIGPYHHHYHAGSYNKHADDLRNQKRISTKNLKSSSKKKKMGTDHKMEPTTND